MKAKLKTLFGLAFAMMASSTAMATTFTLNAYDNVYQGYSGTISDGSTISWMTASYNWSGDIGLVFNGVVIGDVVTGDDFYTLYTAGTGDSMIGGACTATSCISVTNGETVSLYATISSHDGMGNVCCDYNGFTPEITISGLPVPEPAVLPLFSVALASLGFALRRPIG